MTKNSSLAQNPRKRRQARRRERSWKRKRLSIRRSWRKNSCSSGKRPKNWTPIKISILRSVMERYRSMRKTERKPVLRTLIWYLSSIVTLSRGDLRNLKNSPSTLRILTGKQKV
jgi:hypothetical protein